MECATLRLGPASAKPASLHRIVQRKGALEKVLYARRPHVDADRNGLDLSVTTPEANANANVVFLWRTFSFRHIAQKGSALVRAQSGHNPARALVTELVTMKGANAVASQGSRATIVHSTSKFRMRQTHGPI